jgi:hypothetical protein
LDERLGLSLDRQSGTKIGSRTMEPAHFAVTG